MTFSTQNCSVVVVFATKGRPEVLSKVVKRLQSQSHAPSEILISCCTMEDAGSAATLPRVRVLQAEMGLTRQRNAALQALPAGTDFVVFFDDDFVPHDQWIEKSLETFLERNDVAGLTGHVIADGITGEGISFEDAVKLVESAATPRQSRFEAPFSPYGCNMAFRMSAIDGLFFDERLVLYGWQEDRDFGAQVARFGKVGRIDSAIGVHMGVKSGRVSGRKFGYSQISNPVYLVRKGNMKKITALTHIGRNIASNLVKSPFPEAFVDRYGRLVGNIIGLKDVLRGRITPERVLKM